MAATERTYTIPLRREVAKAPKYKKAKKAVSAVREFVIRHSKSSDVRIGKHLNTKLWQHGIKNVPHAIKVSTLKDDKGTIMVELFGAPKEAEKDVSATKKEAEATATPADNKKSNNNGKQ
ncbi:60S ribosomal protein L31 [Candidatus Woesearchaeota archaeon]|nr:60S ribosomal protein L31 [Candidatus Woesearchaeota archaeon]